MAHEMHRRSLPQEKRRSSGAVARALNLRGLSAFNCHLPYDEARALGVSVGEYEGEIAKRRNAAKARRRALRAKARKSPRYVFGIDLVYPGSVRETDLLVRVTR